MLVGDRCVVVERAHMASLAGGPVVVVVVVCLKHKVAREFTRRHMSRAPHYLCAFGPRKCTAAAICVKRFGLLNETNKRPGCVRYVN